MKKIFYLKSNFNRKEQFRILTTIYKENNHLFVSKKPISKLAINHLSNFISSEKKWQKYIGNKGRVVKGKLIDGTIYYKFLNHKTLDTLIIDALSNKQLPLATQYFLSGINLIKNLPSRKINTYPSDKLNQYLKYFGVPPSPNQQYLDIANLDIVTDNLILDSKNNYYLDCGWLTNFPVEKKFVLYRYCLYSALKYRHLFQNYKNLDFSEFAYGELYFPTDWLARAFSSIEIKNDIKNYFLKEENFQAYIHIAKKKCKYIGCHQVTPKPILNAYDHLKHLKTSKHFKTWFFIQKVNNKFSYYLKKYIYLNLILLLNNKIISTFSPNEYL